MLAKKYIFKQSEKLPKASLSETKYRKIINKKKGKIYINSTNRNIFCTLIDLKKKVKTSCSLRVPPYENEFNERINLYKRGMLLGELFGDKIIGLGFRNVSIYLDSIVNKGRRGVIRGLGRKKIKVSFIQSFKGHPHNGCRPSKIRRKKVRTKVKNW